MTGIIEHKFEIRDLLIKELRDEILKNLSESVEDRGNASMLLSGGSTPGPIYKSLSKQNLKWEKIWFGPTDERWVAPDHQDSNERLIRETAEPFADTRGSVEYKLHLAGVLFRRALIVAVDRARGRKVATLRP